MTTTLDDIETAYRAIQDAIDQARQRYRRTLRAGLADGVQQTAVATRLGRTRETIRRDAMTDEETAVIRAADRRRRARSTTTTGGDR